jgi:hypothetical protein
LVRAITANPAQSQHTKPSPGFPFYPAAPRQKNYIQHKKITIHLSIKMTLKKMNYLFYSYLIIGCLNLMMIIYQFFKNKNSIKKSGFLKIFMFWIFGAIFFVLLWPLFLLYQYLRYRQFTTLLKNKVKPFYVFLFTRSIN